jgi:tRNA modification GTPase
LAILQKIYRPRRVAAWRPHVMRYGHVLTVTGQIIDEVLAVWMRAPRSYTGEDVVEISCHGGRIALESVLQRILMCGARMANAGEFTMRAYVAGRIDLSQAEAVMDVIQAQTSQALGQAQAQLQGWLGQQVTQFIATINYELAAVVARIDFPDEVAETAVDSAALAQLATTIATLLAGARTGMVLRDGARVVLMGRPNVGKSSLLNTLLRHDRAIVSPIAGTTRDTLEESADILGVPVRFIDTAGITDDSTDVVEQLGVARSRTAAAHADLALVLIDASQPLTPQDHVALAARGDLPAILVLTKADLTLCDETFREAPLLRVVPFVASVQISNMSGHGIDTLQQTMAAHLLDHAPAHDLRVSNSRHVDALQRCHSHIQDALRALQAHYTADLVAVDLQAAVAALAEITGADVSEALLDTVFARFCIGK